MRIPILLAGPSNQSRELSMSNQVTKNLYPAIDPNNKSLVYLNGTPGLKSFATPTPGANRGGFLFKGLLYVVAHQTLFSIDSVGTHTSIGTIEGGERCLFSRNGNYLIISPLGSTAYINGFTIYTPDQKAYSYDGTTLAEIADPDIKTGDPGQFWVSDVNQALTISSLSFATAESNPDALPRVFVHGEAVLLFGDESIEVWVNSGTGTPPFARASGATLPYGTIAKHSIASGGEGVYFLDNDRVPRVILGGQAIDIGGPSLGQAFEGYSIASDVIGWVHKWDHDEFYTLTFPSADKTWCRSSKASWWFQLSSGVAGGRHCANEVIRAFNKNLVIDASTSKVYEWDFKTYTDDGAAIQRRRRTLPVSAEHPLIAQPGAELEFYNLIVECSRGVGIASGQGSAPTMLIEWSDDDGDTWESQAVELGEMGKKNITVEVDQAGTAENRIYQFTFSDPTRFALNNAFVDVGLALQ
jgi:hypothetical protein